MGDTIHPMEAYQKDKRIACQYGVKCYQKNPAHHDKYKHPPVPTQTQPAKRLPSKPHKRKINPKAALPKAKHQRSESSDAEDESKPVADHALSSSDEEDTSANSSENESSEEEKSNVKIVPEVSKSLEKSVMEGEKKSEPLPGPGHLKQYKDSVPREQKQMIKRIFLLQMPEDFYAFYELCCSLAPKAPGTALKAVGLELVGPFDVLCGKIRDLEEGAEEKALTHWRYFYDPPEFQTVLKGNDKEGLHFGYWRDEDDKEPMFVGKNSAMVDGRITQVAETLFGAVASYAEERLKKASPFETSSISLLCRKVKQFAKSNNLSLELQSLTMKSRNRKSVTKTFHGAGIVVPYDKKTQIGYRTLAATDSEFKKILEKLNDENDDVKKAHMSKLEEMMRLATIAADECDFGTPLELAHDLFTCGLPSLEQRALQMFKMSYSLLKRPIFSKIAEAHLKNRKKSCKLSAF